MKKKETYTKLQRTLALLMALVMGFVLLPVDGLTAFAASAANTGALGVIQTVDDPTTLTRPNAVFEETAGSTTYGSTLNAGKILVGKSVTDGVVDGTSTPEALNLRSELFNMTSQLAASDTYGTWLPAEDNFLVTISQSSQMYGISSRIPVPMDVVFVLDTSGSMSREADKDNNRAQAVVDAANTAIANILSMNDYNRVAVVGFSGNASTLSSLYHYEDSGNNKAATQHLTWSNSQNRSGNIRGRNTNGTVGSGRNGTNGGTNIQDGILQGAKILTGVASNDTYVMLDSNGDGVTEPVTRMPILIVLSDGAATYSEADHEWWNADGNRQGPGSASYAGNGFLAALTAAYYKDAITKHYYGTGSAESAAVYTIGVGLGSIDRQGNAEVPDEFTGVDDVTLAHWTMDPSTWLGRTVNNSAIDNSFNDYWSKYVAASAATANTTFTVQVNNEDSYSFWNYASSEQVWVEGGKGGGRWETRYTYDNIQESVTDLKYNDAYWAASSTTEINNAFDSLVIEIQKRAITAPTLTNTQWGEDYSGFVSFTDPIGEYMEVKGLVGVTGDGYLYQGRRLSQLAEGYDPNWETDASTTEEQAEFNAAIEQALMDRITLSSAAGAAVPTLAQVRSILNVVTYTDADYAANGDVTYNVGGGYTRTFDHDVYGGQLYYTSDTDYGNSFTWFGKVHFPEGETEAKANDEFDVQFIGVAPKNADNAAWLHTGANASLLTDAKNAGANAVVRSYFLYGTAGGVRADGATDMLHFQVRVITSLDEPHQQYISIKAPASLLAMQKVLIDDTDPSNLEAHYDTLVPTRVIYEVGLRSDIDANNVWQIVDKDYLSETLSDGTLANVNADGTINFYTNDWDRAATVDSHTRALAHANFEVSNNNSFYRYEVDTPLLNANGTAVTSAPVAGQTYYYDRTYYKWVKEADGVSAAVEDVERIAITWPADVTAKVIDGRYYVPAGTYTAHTLTSGDDILKEVNGVPVNPTGTASVVTHPQRSGTAADPDYTTWLGNNGKLVYYGTKLKTVTGDDIATAGKETDALIDGKPVMVGDKLTYTVKASNTTNEPATIVITDTIPAGTALVEDSIAVTANGQPVTAELHTIEDGVITWTFGNAAAGMQIAVSFTVTVLESAVGTGTVTNQANILVGANSYSTNLTTNPILGKQALDASGNVVADGLKVGDTVEFRIAFANTTGETADIVIKDIIPAGTTFSGETSHKEELDTTTEPGTLIWTFENVAPGVRGVVTFEVVVNASIAEDADGTLDVENSAGFTVGNDPEIKTNVVSIPVKSGSLQLSKTVANVEDLPDAAKNAKFTLNLVESTGTLAGTYTLTGSTQTSVTFSEGKASVTIAHGETLTIADLPVGVTVTVAEAAVPGFTAAYTPASGSVTVTDGTTPVTVGVVNTYAASAAEIVFSGTKDLVNNDSYDQTKSFSFVLESTDANASLASQATYDASVTVSAAAGKTGSAVFTFPKVTVTAAGDYYWLLSEVNAGASGVTYSTAKYHIHAKVTDDGSGALKVTTLEYRTANADGTWPTAWSTLNTAVSTQLAFTNTFAPVKTSLKLEATKVLTGADLTDNQFSFSVAEVDGGAFSFIANVATGQNKADGSVIFTEIEYDSAGIHFYKITEDSGTSANMIYSGKAYYIKVVVEENNGALSTTVYLYDYSDWNLTTLDALKSALVFNNIYTGEYDVTLEAYKKLDGRDMADREFNFIAVDDATGKTVTTGHNVAAENGVSSKVVFETIGYGLEDLGDPDDDGKYSKTFQYKITEVPGGDGEISYAQSTYYADVTVTFDPAAGWSSEVVYRDATGAPINAAAVTFSNTHNPPPVNIDPQTITPRLVKTVEGTAIPADLTFGFVMYKAAKTMNGTAEVDDGYAVYDFTKNAAGNAGALVSTGVSAPTKEGGTAENTDLAVTFNKLTFYEEGVYQAWVMEAGAGTESHGVKYTDARYLLKFTVTRDADTGVLKVSAAYYKTADDKTGSTDIADYTVPVDTTVPLVFTNQYNAKGSMVIKAVKALSGRALGNLKFNFTLTEKGTNNVHTGTNNGEEIIFDTLFFDDAGFTGDTKTLTYVMEETAGQLPGITYDKSKYELTVTLTHNGNGTITGEVTAIKQTHGADGKALDTAKVVNSTADIVFQNSGVPYKGAELSLPVSKVLTGRTMKANQFSFQIELIAAKDGTADDSKALTGVTLGVKDTVSNASDVADGAAASMALKLQYPASTPVGYYTYEVTEVNNNLAGVTYDTTKYVVVVRVHDDDLNGELSAEIQKVTKVKGSESTAQSTSAAMAFANAYIPTEYTFNLIGQKTLTGRDMRADQFDFEVLWDSYQKDAASDPVDKGGVRVATGSNAAAENGTAAAVAFTDITVSEPGIYTYTVKELSGSLKGVDYDTETTYRVVVTVTDNNTTGKLEAAFTVARSIAAGGYGTPVAYDPTDADKAAENAARIAFNNVYDAEDTELVLKASKTLTGRDMTAGEFAFEVYEVSVNSTATGRRVAVAGSPNGNDGSAAAFTFSAIPYTAAGTYVYNVREVTPSAANVTIDGTASYTVTVVVEDDTAEGKLKITSVTVNGVSGDPSTSADVLTFKNKYAPDPVGTSFNVYKALTGKAFETETFTFTVGLRYRSDETSHVESLLLTNDSLTVDKSGVATYPGSNALYEYKKPGVYTWVVVEERSVSGYTGEGIFTYDSAEYTITEVVKDNTATGKLYVESTVIKKNGTPVNAIQVTNGFTPKPVKQNLDLVLDGSGADKTLNGRDILDTPTFKDNFTFEVKDLQGVKVAEGTSDVSGQITVDYDLGTDGVQTDGFTYTTAGTYTYTVSEVKGSSPAVTYDSAVWTVVIEVTYDAASGELTAKAPVITAVKDTTATDTSNITFTNTYDPTDVEVEIVRENGKVLGGNRTEQVAGEFEFHILNAAGNTVAKGFNDADGSVSFGKLSFSAPTVAKFTIVEVDKGATGMTYSDVEYKLTVTVTDDPVNGKLVASSVITDADNADVTNSWQFVNTYKGQPTTATVHATKVLDGRKQVEGEFTFTLTPSVTNPSAVTVTGGKNDADGNVAFHVEGLSEVGDYFFSMQEQGVDTERMDYDSDRTVGVIITVTDPGAGYLHADVTYQTGTAPVFTNVYTPEPVAVRVEATKKLVGRDMKAGEFKFVIEDDQGSTLATGTNTETGKIVFTEFMMTESTGKTIYIKEIDTDAEHVTYDSKVYILTVDAVNEDEQGVLVPVVHYPADGVVFTNKYLVPSDPQPEPTPLSPDTGDHTPFAMWFALLAASICGMAVLEKKRRAYREN